MRLFREANNEVCHAHASNIYQGLTKINTHFLTERFIDALLRNRFICKISHRQFKVESNYGETLEKHVLREAVAVGSNRGRIIPKEIDPERLCKEFFTSRYEVSVKSMGYELSGN